MLSNCHFFEKNFLKKNNEIHLNPLRFNFIFKSTSCIICLKIISSKCLSRLHFTNVNEFYEFLQHLWAYLVYYVLFSSFQLSTAKHHFSVLPTVQLSLGYLHRLHIALKKFNGFKSHELVYHRNNMTLQSVFQLVDGSIFRMASCSILFKPQPFHIVCGNIWKQPIL